MVRKRPRCATGLLVADILDTRAAWRNFELPCFMEPLASTMTCFGPPSSLDDPQGPMGKNGDLGAESATQAQPPSDALRSVGTEAIESVR